MKVSELIKQLETFPLDMEVALQFGTEREHSVIYEFPRKLGRVTKMISGHTSISYVLLEFGSKLPKNNKDTKE